MNLPVEVLVGDKRRADLQKWIEESTPYGWCELEVASADASFRRYFRIRTKDGPKIVMDAPPHLEPSDSFIELASEMSDAGIPVPKVDYLDLDRGFLVISDFGNIHLQDAIESEHRNELYDLAIRQIFKMQKNMSQYSAKLPVFDLNWQLKELEIFREWCLPKVPHDEFVNYAMPLVDGIDSIPKCFVHRDFHCRNILVLKDGSVGLIDFQGAMRGPITYDLVSLLRDCYVDNSAEWITRQVRNFRTHLVQNELLTPDADEGTIKRWFDWSGLQRHLKCLGIFHRLKLRDGKPKYLEEVPRVLQYVRQVLNNYPELCDLHALVGEATILSPHS